MTETLIIVQARMGSTRFPGKVLAPLLGQPMLLWELLRLRDIPDVGLVVATPPDESQRPIWELCDRHGYAWHAPNVAEDNVLSRYYQTAEAFEAEVVVRVTGDTPLLDPEVVRFCLTMHEAGPRRADHTGIDQSWPDGQDVEAMTFTALETAYHEAKAPYEREHVTPFLWQQPGLFLCRTFPCPLDLSSYQYSVDTREDLQLVSALFSWCLDHYGLGFGWEELWWAIESRPHLKRLMQQRPARNAAYVAQVGAATWEEARYGV